jgi:hypothetical protein
VEVYSRDGSMPPFIMMMIYEHAWKSGRILAERMLLACV